MIRDPQSIELLHIMRRKREELVPKISYGERVPFSKKPKGKKRLLIPVQYYNIYEER